MRDSKSRVRTLLTRTRNEREREREPCATPHSGDRPDPPSCCRRCCPHAPLSPLGLFVALTPEHSKHKKYFTGRTAHPLGGAGALVRPRPLRAGVHRAAILHGRDVQHDDRHHRGRDPGRPAELHRNQGRREPRPKCENGQLSSRLKYVAQFLFYGPGCYNFL